MRAYKVESVRGQKPTKKNPELKKITGPQALEMYLNALKKDVKVIAVLPGGFAGYQVVTAYEE